MAAKSKKKTATAKPTLLAGGNPQIAKGDGDTPVQTYIAAIPGWKSDVGCRLDAFVVHKVPNVRKAVKWNSPFYGIEGQGWFLSFHCFTKYVKVAFFRGTTLRLLPPVVSKAKETRYFHIHEDDELDAAQLATWIRQAAALPGWVLASICWDALIWSDDLATALGGLDRRESLQVPHPRRSDPERIPSKSKLEGPCLPHEGRWRASCCPRGWR